MIDFQQVEMLSFDCYGTIIDWETGILGAIRPLLDERGLHHGDDGILEIYAAEEARAEGGPYLRYREVLRSTLEGIAARLGFTLHTGQEYRLAESLPAWEPFPDTVAALGALSARFRLAILSNVDRDLFAHTAARLSNPFDLVVTAEDIGSYKPSHANFRALMERSGVPARRHVHVAQSIYHDVIPAGSLGLGTVWVNRRSARTGMGATLPANGRPDVEVPDLASLVSLCYSSRGSAPGAPPRSG